MFNFSPKIPVYEVKILGFVLQLYFIFCFNKQISIASSSNENDNIIHKGKYIINIQNEPVKTIQLAIIFDFFPDFLKIDDPDERQQTVIEHIIGENLAEIIRHILQAPSSSQREIALAAGLTENAARSVLKSARDRFSAVNTTHLVGLAVTKDLAVPAISDLSPLQHDVVGHLAAGFTAKEIAARLGMLVSQVREQIGLVIKCLEARDHREAMVKALSKAGALRSADELFDCQHWFRILVRPRDL